MGFVSSHKELSVSGECTLENTIVVILGGNEAYALRGRHDMREGPNCRCPSERLPLAKTELFPENMLELRKDESGDEKFELSPTHESEDLIRLATGKDKGRDQHIRIQDDPHGKASLLADRVDQLIDILFRPNPKSFGLPRSGLLKSAPASLHDVLP